jgi:hypothetical protein
MVWRHISLLCWCVYCVAARWRLVYHVYSVSAGWRLVYYVYSVAARWRLVYYVYSVAARWRLVYYVYSVAAGYVVVSSSSSVGATARCGLWPVEQYFSICPYPCSSLVNTKNRKLLHPEAYLFFGRNNSPVGQGLLIHEVSRPHTTTQNSR